MAQSIAYPSLQDRAVPNRRLERMLALFLAPGILITSAFLFIASIAAKYQVPASLALLFTWLVAGLPILSAILLYEGWKRNGRMSLAGVVLNREPLAVRQYLWLVLFPLSFLAALGIPDPNHHSPSNRVRGAVKAKHLSQYRRALPAQHNRFDRAAGIGALSKVNGRKSGTPAIGLLQTS